MFPTFYMLHTLFNSAYFLARKERLFSDFEDLLVLEEKTGMRKTQGYCTDHAAASFVDFVGKSMKGDLVKDLLSAHYYAILTDSGAISSIFEQEAFYVLFLSPSSGLPVLKFLIVESPEDAHADDLKACIENSFHRIGIAPLHTRLASPNLDGAAINTGIHSGFRVRFKESASWISLVHCFNHRLELTVKDTFDDTFLRTLIPCY